MLFSILYSLLGLCKNYFVLNDYLKSFGCVEMLTKWFEFVPFYFWGK